MKRTNYKGYIIDTDDLGRTYIYNTASPYSESDDRNYHTGRGTLNDARPPSTQRSPSAKEDHMKVIERPNVTIPATKDDFTHLCDVSELAYTSAEAKRELAELTGWEVKTVADVWRVMGAVEAAVPAHWARHDEARTMQRMRGRLIAPLREADVISPLARIRRAKGLTQKQLAELANMPQQTISRLERGDRSLNNTRGDTLRRLAEALDVAVDDLLA